MGPDRLHHADVNWWVAQCAFLGTSQRGRVQESRDLWLTSCGFPETAFNRAFLKDPEGDVRAALERAEAWFAELDLPYLVTLRGDREAACASTLRDAGYERDGEPTPVMLLDPIRVEDGRIEGLEILEVRDEDTLAAFGETTFEGFGIPRAAAPLFVTEQFLRLPGVRLHLGIVDGVPVTTSAMIPTPGLAGVYFVATVDGYRRRGLGEAMTWAALRSGAELGCTAACLQASVLGAPVYARMGFETPVHQVSYRRRGRDG